MKKRKVERRWINNVFGWKADKKKMVKSGYFLSRPTKLNLPKMGKK